MIIKKKTWTNFFKEFLQFTASEKSESLKGGLLRESFWKNLKYYFYK